MLPDMQPCCHLLCVSCIFTQSSTRVPSLTSSPLPLHQLICNCVLLPDLQQIFCYSICDRVSYSVPSVTNRSTLNVITPDMGTVSSFDTCPLCHHTNCISCIITQLASLHHYPISVPLASLLSLPNLCHCLIGFPLFFNIPFVTTTFVSNVT